METLLVYGLVVLFFVLLILFIILVLSNHPYNEPEQTSEMQASSMPLSSNDTKVAYGVVSLLFIAFCVLTWLIQGKRTKRSTHA